MKVKNLKLVAKTIDDISVLSAHLQDSIVNVSDIAKLEKMKGDISQMKIFISKVKPYENDYPSISNLINGLIQQ